MSVNESDVAVDASDQTGYVNVTCVFTLTSAFNYMDHHYRKDH